MENLLGMALNLHSLVEERTCPLYAFVKILQNKSFNGTLRDVDSYDLTQVMPNEIMKQKALEADNLLTNEDFRKKIGCECPMAVLVDTKRITQEIADFNSAISFPALCALNTKKFTYANMLEKCPKMKSSKCLL